MPTRIEDIHFPLYRKYKNGKNYFKIINANSFEEIRLVGNKKEIKITEARQFPEKTFLHDLIFNYHAMAVEVGEREYEDLKDR